MRIDKSPPIQINEIGMCYFAALIEGLRLINETAADRPELAENFDANALVHFTRTKGQQIIDALYPGDQFEKALATPVYQQPQLTVMNPPKEKRTTKAQAENIPTGKIFERPLSHIDVLMEIERNLEGEIRYIRQVRFGAEFKEAIASFKEVIARSQMRQIAAA